MEVSINHSQSLIIDGIKTILVTRLLISNEFNVWFNEIKNNKNFKNLNNFMLLEYKIKFYTIKLLYSGEKLKVLR